ncbi:MAG: HIT domain-containing protein [Planctomycetes bacterium]|nr:HIT domain-containing protein [Planctomycetota bacterium]
MTYEQLWAPWRLDYIAGDAEQSAEKRESTDQGCFLCRYRDDDRDAANYLVSRSDHSLVVLNRYPYNNGHLLVAPRAHKAELADLGDDELLDGLRQVRRMVEVLRRVLRADGFNVGLNLGHIAGAGLPGHLHWHIVPRWNGDTNFMPVLAQTKVIPQSLESLYDLLRDALVEG